jgi:alpha-amylase/alpha-mannosidase (GH57 family)
MERYLCIHGHFYQPPRENPWLEAVEIQDSAYPYHDWDERITAECYAPNSASRILDQEGHILRIASNYARISFNFGPTLLSWMETNSAEVYAAILQADKQSIEWRSGHGNALAQAYNHMIMPLANERDRQTQVVWGIRDFAHRFRRFPEGMWLPETAVDLKTLDVLAGCGIKFTVLAPHQARRVRKLGAPRWKDVSGGSIDPSRAYLQNLPSGRNITLFFYDGPISAAIAFEGILKNGEDLAHRFLSGFSDARDWPQMLHIATDGETYGHHHKFGDMALAFAMNYLESNALARLTNYGEYLEKSPPLHEVQVVENTSWSCMHGIERWRGDCGCNSGAQAGWNQQWRKPLREALDWLRDRLAKAFEASTGGYLQDPWKARDDYINVMFDRSEENVRGFTDRHGRRELSHEEKIRLLKLLEMQRNLMLMYTSCGWFFDELSGIETVQVIEYAARAVQLASELFSEKGLEERFARRLAAASSNLPEHANGARIYEKFVAPVAIDLKKVAAHHAISSVVEDLPETSGVFSYSVAREDYRKLGAGRASLALGRVAVSSNVTLESEMITFCTLHLGGHIFNGGVRTFRGSDAYGTMKQQVSSAFEKGDFADVIRLMDAHFGMHNYSVRHLFRDKQREVLGLVLEDTMRELELSHRSVFENNRILMSFLKEMGLPVPKAFRTAEEFVLNLDLERIFQNEKIDLLRLEEVTNAIHRSAVEVDSVRIEFLIRRNLEKLLKTLSRQPFDEELLLYLKRLLEVLRVLPLEVNLWAVQNIFYRTAVTDCRESFSKAAGGDDSAKEWLDHFMQIGQLLFFASSAIYDACAEGQ